MLFEYYKNHPHIREINFLLKKHQEISISLKNLSGSSLILVLTALYQENEKNMVVIFPDKEQAMYAYTDFINELGENQVFYFPSSYKRKLKNRHFDHTQVI
ncbi:MAG: hypothetical protein ACUVQP_04450, partial [Bacteroidales bacterium]